MTPPLPPGWTIVTHNAKARTYETYTNGSHTEKSVKGAWRIHTGQPTPPPRKKAKSSTNTPKPKPMPLTSSTKTNAAPSRAAAGKVISVMSTPRDLIVFSDIEPPDELKHMNLLPDRIRVATDCSGLDAPIHALRLLGIKHKHIFSSEIEKAARCFLEQNYAEGTLFGDISQRDVAFAGESDLYVAGFPCQSFSMMNAKKKDTDARKELWRHCVEYIRTKRPKAFVLENVRALLHAYQGSVWQALQEALNNIPGYEWDHRILNAKEHDCPQSRQRLYIVGVEQSQMLFKLRFPDPIPLTRSCLDVLNRDEDQGDNALGGGPMTPCYERFVEQWDFPPGTTGLLEFNAATFTTRPYEQQTEDTKAKALSYVRADVAPCLVAHSPGHFAVHLNRLLNTNEMLRLQGFDPQIVRCNGVTARQMQKLVGNSMCVDVLKALFTAMLR